ncbi:MAG: hypothetical protein IJF65_03550, partial [Clostridia bacterium]|nr:hypothetical protein [Clostridia bacterium]
MKRILSLCLCLAMVLGCVSFASAEDVKYKDTVILATGSDQNYMDGQMNNTNDKVLRTVYSSLVKRNSQNEIVGDLAE